MVSEGSEKGGKVSVAHWSVCQGAGAPAGPLTPPIQVRRNGVRKLHKRWTLAIRGALPADLPCRVARPVGSPGWDSRWSGRGAVVTALALARRGGRQIGLFVVKMMLLPPSLSLYCNDW